MENRFGEANFIPPEVRDGSPESRVTNRDTDHQSESEGTVDDALSELSVFLAVVLIEVQIGRIVCQRAEPYVVRLSNGSADDVLKDLSNAQLVKVKAGHNTPLSLLEKWPAAIFRTSAHFRSAKGATFAGCAEGAHAWQ